MKDCYINGIGCVSAQETTVDNDIENYQFLTERITHAHRPNYREFIKPTMIRRMSTGVKMGVVAASLALKEANLETPDAIISGTGLGCSIDSDKFLKKIVDNNEEFLTPTAFIQSTHNTVGAQVALGLGCNAYNVTYVHNALSFESAMIDAQLLLNEGESNVLFGGVDELGAYTTSLFDLIGHIKKEEVIENGILDSKTKGAIFSEGSQFFVLGDERSDSSYAKLVDVAVHNVLPKNEIEEKLVQFLSTNNLTIGDIDAVVLGTNGDVEFDGVYADLQESVFENTQQIYYKHLSGEYNTASAFGFWTACKILKTQSVPTNLKLNTVKSSSIRNVLLYNQYRSENHSFTLLSSC
ncbi:MAG: beta-ketoacyl synthase chain length factor [Urechidicola sp.]|nr:beta-ketoacyl synthase chain length factor [Urechidicola sp.]